MTLKACQLHALRCLSRREHAPDELKKKLLQKGYPIAWVTETLAWAEHHGYLDAQRFARSFVRYRYSQGMGPVKIRSELAQKGLSWPTDPEGVLDWQRLCWYVWLKKAQHESCEEKVRRFLLQRGFDSVHIKFAQERKDKEMDVDFLHHYHGIL